jgi:heme/copper-type cytochrome/quinol oxidase subunit 2
MRPRLPLRALLALVLFAAPASAQEGEVVATKAGFKPRVLKLRKGDTTHLVLKSGDGEEHCFAVDELRIEKRIRAGKPTPLDVTPERVGSFVFYDCLAPESEALRGKLVVAE